MIQRVAPPSLLTTPPPVQPLQIPPPPAPPVQPPPVARPIASMPTVPPSLQTDDFVGKSGRALRNHASHLLSRRRQISMMFWFLFVLTIPATFILGALYGRELMPALFQDVPSVANRSQDPFLNAIGHPPVATDHGGELDAAVPEAGEAAAVRLPVPGEPPPLESRVTVVTEPSKTVSMADKGTVPLSTIVNSSIDPDERLRTVAAQPDQPQAPPDQSEVPLAGNVAADAAPEGQGVNAVPISRPATNDKPDSPANFELPDVLTKKCERKPVRGLGTAIHWEKTPDIAGQLAKEQGKLVFLLQVSGNFAREEFT